MPSLYYMNAPPHPFWDFVAGIEDHPIMSQHPRAGPPPMPTRPTPEQAQPQASTSEKAKGKQAKASAEDPPEIDPASVRKDMPYRGRGRFANVFNDTDNKEKTEEGDDHHRGKRGCHGRRHGREYGAWGHRGGPPPFMFGANFPFGPGGPFGRAAGPPGHEGPEGHGPHGGFRGPGSLDCAGGPLGHDAREGHGPHGGFRGRGGPHRGRFGHHHHQGPHSRSPPREGPFTRPQGEGGFELGSFLNNLGERLGVDLDSAAEGLGLKQPRSTETDFEPRTDIFDTAEEYIVHLSLPGAKKSDVGVDWDGEHSNLHIAGVVHRPGVDEDLLNRLVVDGRKRETGVFEKTIRLGTSKQPANVHVEGITAKMVDGVLVVRVPKTEKTFEKKEVHIDESSPSPVAAEAPEDAYMNEKDLLFDAEEDKEMYDADTTHHTAAPASETGKGKHREAEDEAAGAAAAARNDRSETVGHEQQTLPRYEVEEPAESKLAKEHSQDDNLSDWEKSGSDDEGEYVKINVD